MDIYKDKHPNEYIELNRIIKNELPEDFQFLMMITSNTLIQRGLKKFILILQITSLYKM